MKITLDWTIWIGAFVALLYLKLMHFIAWPWFVVFMPLWLPAAILGCILMFAAGLVLLVTMFAIVLDKFG